MLQGKFRKYGIIFARGLWARIVLGLYGVGPRALARRGSVDGWDSPGMGMGGGSRTLSGDGPLLVESGE